MMPSAYGLFAATGCVVAVLWLFRHRDGLDVSENEFWAAMWTLLLGGILGAKALFVVLGWEHYARGELRFWADFRVGFVFFGGLLGAALAGGAFAMARARHRSWATLQRSPRFGYCIGGAERGPDPALPSDRFHA